MHLHLDQVPLRDPTMQPEEILLSESQERMLLVCKPEHFTEIQKIFSRWGLDASRVGEIVPQRKVTLFWKGEVLTEIDPHLLVENAPAYNREFTPWTPVNQVKDLPAKHSSVRSLLDQVGSELASPRACSRAPIYRQYDQRVGGMTAHGAEHDVAILRLPRSGRGLSVAVGCRPEWMKRDAQIGAFDAVFYPSLQMMIKGARPVGVTDCLNFASPERPKIMSEFVASVEAIRDASLALNIPVVSGNVSFYNETNGNPITSTPACGLVGLRPSVEVLAEDQFQKAGHALVLVGTSFVQSWTGDIAWKGALHPQQVAGLGALFLKIAALPSVKSSQMVGRGGLAQSLARMCTANLGAEVTAKLSPEQLGTEVLYQAIFETADADAILNLAKATPGVDAQVIGQVQAGDLKIHGEELKLNDIVKWPEEGAGRVFETMG